VRFTVWGAALAIVVLGVCAAFLVPARLPRVRPADLWGRPAAPPPVGGPGAAGSPGGSQDITLGVTRPAVHVVEQVSPIVASNSTLSESLGIETAGGAFTPVLPKGAPVPVMRFVTFKTSADDQREIRLHVLRGQSDKAALNHSLGWVRVAGLPPGPKGSIQVTVGFRVADGAIVLAAVDPASGRDYQVEASEAPPGFPR
jgi:molecular chaperone DnaK